ncbi:MAG: 2-amino-4-hydroxy-6-hydroxymethyldihydropteridine diphosphokinase [Bacteroidota bacterium]|nr:2-amino-4-hydroxy-6-hydroxymethyldihydropteridine diphosphokinase [Bacteroidota bacterium]
MVTAYLGLGSNVGERISFIENAVLEIGKIKDTVIIKSSAIYETEPWGNIKQDDYLNSVIEIETRLKAEALLMELKNIEKRLGRIDNKRWSEREIDIDLLFYGEEIIENDLIKLPHRQIENRRFVLIPMNEIAQCFIHPVFKKTISQLLNDTKDELNVVRYHPSKIKNS